MENRIRALATARRRTHPAWSGVLPAIILNVARLLEQPPSRDSGCPARSGQHLPAYSVITRCTRGARHRGNRRTSKAREWRRGHRRHPYAGYNGNGPVGQRVSQARSGTIQSVLRDVTCGGGRAPRKRKGTATCRSQGAHARLASSRLNASVCRSGRYRHLRTALYLDVTLCITCRAMVKTVRQASHNGSDLLKRSQACPRAERSRSRSSRTCSCSSGYTAYNAWLTFAVQPSQRSTQLRYPSRYRADCCPRTTSALLPGCCSGRCRARHNGPLQTAGPRSAVCAGSS